MARLSTLHIGVNRYEQFPDADLPTAKADARMWERRIDELMGPHGAQTEVLIEQDTTKAGILDALRRLAAGAGVDDHLLVTFSGRGAGPLHVTDRGRLAELVLLCPRDVTGGPRSSAPQTNDLENLLSLWDIAEALGDRAAATTLFVDASWGQYGSGAGRRLGVADPVAPPGPQMAERVDQMRIVVGSNFVEGAIDIGTGSDGTNQRGAFSYVVSGILRRQTVAIDPGGRAYLPMTYQDLLEQVGRGLKRRNVPQTPMFLGWTRSRFTDVFHPSSRLVGLQNQPQVPNYGDIQVGSDSTGDTTFVTVAQETLVLGEYSVYRVDVFNVASNAWNTVAMMLVTDGGYMPEHLTLLPDMEYWSSLPVDGTVGNPAGITSFRLVCVDTRHVPVDSPALLYGPTNATFDIESATLVASRLGQHQFAGGPQAVGVPASFTPRFFQTDYVADHRPDSRPEFGVRLGFVVDPNGSWRLTHIEWATEMVPQVDFLVQSQGKEVFTFANRQPSAALTVHLLTTVSEPG